MHNIRTHHQHSEGKVFSWITLIMSFGISMTFPIFPNFVKEILNTDSAVSVFYMMVSLSIFLAALFSTIIFKKIHRTTITKISLLIISLTLFSLIFVTKLVELSILHTIRMWFTLFLLIALCLFVRDFAKEKKLGEEEGIYYKFGNIGYFAGPLVGGFLSSYLGHESVFLLAAATMMIGLIYFYQKHIVENHPSIINRKQTSDTKLFSNIKDFFSSKERAKAYVITMLMITFIAFKRLYIPLYVTITGYVESLSGIILALGILPLILLEVKVGEYGDKKGIKKSLTLGFSLVSLCLLIIFLNEMPILNFAILILMNIGIAFIEPLQETFLLKNLPKEKEDDLYGIFMTSDPIAFSLAPGIGAIILFFLPFNYLFLGFGILMLLTGIFTYFTLKD